MEKDELISVLMMALLFTMVLAGRELGTIYSDFQEVSKLSIVLYIREEELAGFVREVLAGGDADLEVGLAFSLPSARSIEGPVTKVPDYVRRWFISVTVSPIIVKQPELSDIEVQLWVEDELMLTKTFPFEREKVPYARLLERTMTLTIKDSEKFRRTVQEASERYGGEVEFRFTGRALAHILFLKEWLPFYTVRYPLVRAPQLDFLSSNWTDTDGQPIKRIVVGADIFVSLHLRNPTRVHSIWENVTVTIYSVNSDEPVRSTWKEIGVAPETEATYIFSFSFEEPGIYSYILETSSNFNWDKSPRLRVDLVN